MAWVTVSDVAPKDDKRIVNQGDRNLPELASSICTRIRSSDILKKHLDGNAPVEEWADLSPETINFALKEDLRVLAEELDVFQAVIDGAREKYFSGK